MRIHELADLVSDVIKPVVEFKKGIEEIESFIESGMRARLIEASPKHGEMDLKFDFSEFDSFNQRFENANYYDEQGKPTMTARQAGFYTPVKSFLFELKEDSGHCFEVVEAESLKLYDHYKASNETVSYVQWLETIVSHILK